MNRFEILIPRHPSVHLKADSHVPWYKKVQAEKADKNDAIACILATGDKSSDMPWDKCNLHLIFYSNRNIRRDPDNYIARSKKFIDACVFARVISDDSSDVIQTLTVEFDVDKKYRPSTRMIFEKVEGH